MARYAINVGSSAGLDLVEENSLPRTPRPSPYPHVTGVSGPHPADLVEITSISPERAGSRFATIAAGACAASVATWVPTAPGQAGATATNTHPVPQHGCRSITLSGAIGSRSGSGTTT